MRFSNKETNHVERLGEWSNNVVDVFTSTINNLQTINQEVDKHHGIKSDQKQKLEQELEQLQSIKSQNQVVIDKISTIFN